MNDNKLPDYLTESEGAVTIKLSRQADIAGAKVQTLKMREPLVRDDEAAQLSANGNGTAYEMTLFANLLDVSVDDLRNLTTRDYRRIAAAYGRFTD
ncbi:tail assembly protein E [Xanthomonas phage Murka]|nr:tail assembly protein E [Xanthomonas phage Murka]